MAYISILQLQAAVERVLDQAAVVRDYERKHWHIPTPQNDQTNMHDDTLFGGMGMAGMGGMSGVAIDGGLRSRDIAERDRLLHEALVRMDIAVAMATQLHADLPGETAITDMYHMLNNVLAVMLPNPDITTRKRHVDTLLQLLCHDIDDPIIMIQQVLARHAPHLLQRYRTILAHQLSELAADSAPVTSPSPSSPSSSSSSLSSSSVDMASSRDNPSSLSSLSANSLSSSMSSYNPFSSTPPVVNPFSSTPSSSPSSPSSSIPLIDSSSSLSSNDMTSIVIPSIRQQLWLFAEHVMQTRAGMYTSCARPDMRDAIERIQSMPIWKNWRGMEFGHIIALSCARIGYYIIGDHNTRVGILSSEQLQALCELLEHLVAERAHMRISALHDQPITLRTPYGCGQFIPPLRTPSGISGISLQAGTNAACVVRLPYGIAYVQRELVELVSHITSSITSHVCVDTYQWYIYIGVIIIIIG